MAPVAVPKLDELSLQDKPEEQVKPKAEVEGDDGEEDDDEVEGEGGAGAAGDAKKKKKKKKPKKKKVAAVQSEPPRVGLSKVFPKGVYPVGEEVEYKNE